MKRFIKRRFFQQPARKLVGLFLQHVDLNKTLAFEFSQEPFNVRNVIMTAPHMTGLMGFIIVSKSDYLSRGTLAPHDFINAFNIILGVNSPATPIALNLGEQAFTLPA